MARRLDDWISAYIEYTEDTEPPESYHYWTALSTIVSVLGRKVYIKWGSDKIYPNMYIILVGPSGRTRKGTALEVGKYFLTKLDVKMGADSSTREQLIVVMETAVDNFLDRTTNNIVYHSSVTILSKELAVFLGQKDIKFLADLTDWYDSADKWKRETKTSGKSSIKGICLNIIAGTAPDWFQSMFPMEALSGGFTSRCIFISEQKKKQIVALPREDKDKLHLRDVLLDDLSIIQTMTGEFTVLDSTKQLYADWYQTQEDRANNGEFAVADPRFQGYCERRATHIKKICIALSASRKDTAGDITPGDFERAKLLMEKAEMKMPYVFGGLGMSPFGTVISNIKEFIDIKQKVYRSEILNAFYRDLGSAAALDEVIRILEGMRVITKELVENDGQKEYLYTKIISNSTSELKKEEKDE